MNASWPRRFKYLGGKTDSAAVNAARREVIRSRRLQELPRFFRFGIWEGDLSQMCGDRTRRSAGGESRDSRHRDEACKNVVGCQGRTPSTPPAILNAMSRMLEEIRQQPEALERTLSAEL